MMQLHICNNLRSRLADGFGTAARAAVVIGAFAAPFLARGGRVVAVCDTPEKQKAAAALKGAIQVKSYAYVADALLLPCGIITQ